MDKEVELYFASKQVTLIWQLENVSKIGRSILPDLKWISKKEKKWTNGISSRENEQ